MSSKHTPGPWRLTGDKLFRLTRQIEDTNGMGLAHAYGNDAEADANARLIAAAPDLLAAIETLLPHVLHYASMPHAHSDAHKDAANAAAAIAKAAGG
jgi:hypothetical protein